LEYGRLGGGERGARGLGARARGGAWRRAGRGVAARGAGQQDRASASCGGQEAGRSPGRRRGCRRTSAGSAGRWRPLRGGQASGGRAREEAPGGGARWGGPRGLHLGGARPAPENRALGGAGGDGPRMGLPRRPPGWRRVAAALGSRGAAAAGDGGAAVLLPGE
jgi:hypothetical protein